MAKNSKATIDLDDVGDMSLENTDNVKMRITGVGSKTIQTSSSIFSRLGGKSNDDQTITKEIKPILKNTAKNVGISKTKKLKKLYENIFCPLQASFHYC